MSCRHTLRRAVLTLCVALSCGLGVVAKNIRLSNTDYFDPEKWSLVPADNDTITSLSDLKDGVYSIQLSGERSSCRASNGPEYLGFNNRTCSTSLSVRRSAGPVMRGSSKSMMWREWFVRVEERGSDKLVSLQAFIAPDMEKEARCLGYVSTFYGDKKYKGTCVIPPYGNGLFLSSKQAEVEKTNSQTWVVSSHKEFKDSFEFIASNKPDICLRVLAVENCDTMLELVEREVEYYADSTKHTAWKLIKRYDLVPKPSQTPPPTSGTPPSPPPPPPPLVSPSPPPPGRIPGPTIAADSTTSVGYVNVYVTNVGGDSRCSVSSVEFAYRLKDNAQAPLSTVSMPVNAESLKFGTTLSLPIDGYYTIDAVGKCVQGGSTEQSNRLTVLSIRSGPIARAGTTLYVLTYQKASSDFTVTEKKQVCINLLSIVPNGTCVVDSVETVALRRSLLAPTEFSKVSGSVQYNRLSDAVELSSDLEGESSSVLSALANCIVSSPNEVVVDSASTETQTEQSIPGSPVFVEASNVKQTTATVTWLDGRIGRPEETYTVNCVPSANSVCTDSGVEMTDLPRGTETAAMTGLTPNTTYGCWVIAVNNAGSTCSASPAKFTTTIAPGAPSSFSSSIVGSTSASFDWADGLSGTPVESYTILCTTNTTATSCTSPGGSVINSTSISRGTQSGTITGLSVSTSYKCWVKAGNTVGQACSNGQEITTAPPLVSGQVIASDQSATITPSPYTAPSGASSLTYQAQCLSGSATTCDPQATGTGALQPSPGSSTIVPVSVSGLTNDVLYQCFTVITFTLNSETQYVCSGPMQAKPFGPPQVQSVTSGDQKLIITPSSYTAPSEGSNVQYQAQCLGESATMCDPLASGTGALQPTAAQSSQAAITVSGLPNNVIYQCFSVVTYNLNGKTQYTCSESYAAIPGPPPTLSSAGVIAGTKKITITPDAYSLPNGTANLGYQVQCFQATTSVCNPNSPLSPSPALSSPSPIVLSGLNDRSPYSCFSVVSYTLNSSTRYTCSDVFTAMPYTQPSNLTAQGVISQNQKMTIYVASYSAVPAQTSVEYQVQCLDSSATVCNPAATGSGALQPSTADSFDGFKQVPGLTTGTTYQCFSVISYSLLGARKYTCSDPFEVISAQGPILTTQKVLASSGQLSITPDVYSPPSGASNVGYQAQCFNSASIVCDLVNDVGTPSTPLTSPGAIVVGSLSNNQQQYCFSVVSYDVSGTTRYTCSAAFEAIPYAAPQTLSSSDVVSGNQQLTITPPSYNAPTGASNVKYQVQCLDSSATVCDPLATGTGAVQPSVAQSSQSPIVVSALTNGVTYKCFTVVTYSLSSNTKYTCSTTGFSAVPSSSPPPPPSSSPPPPPSSSPPPPPSSSPPPPPSSSPPPPPSSSPPPPPSSSPPPPPSSSPPPPPSSSPPPPSSSSPPPPPATCGGSCTTDADCGSSCYCGIGQCLLGNCCLSNV